MAARQVIYQQPLPKSASDGANPAALLRFLPLILVPSAFISFLAQSAVFAAVLVLIIGGVMLYVKFGPERKVAYPSFAAILGDRLELAGQGITKPHAPALSLPLSEVSWGEYRNTRDDLLGVSIFHNDRTYRLNIARASEFNADALRPYAPDIIAALERQSF